MSPTSLRSSLALRLSNPTDAAISVELGREGRVLLERELFALSLDPSAPGACAPNDHEATGGALTAVRFDRKVSGVDADDSLAGLIERPSSVTFAWAQPSQWSRPPRTHPLAA